MRRLNNTASRSALAVICRGIILANVAMIAGAATIVGKTTGRACADETAQLSLDSQIDTAADRPANADELSQLGIILRQRHRSSFLTILPKFKRAIAGDIFDPAPEPETESSPTTTGDDN